MFAKNENGTIKYLAVVTKPSADSPRNPYATGYGAKIPTATLALVGDKWQRVYVTQYSNSGTAWVQIKGERVCITEREPNTGAELQLLNVNFRQFVTAYIECLKWSTSGECNGVEYTSLEDFQLSEQTWEQTRVTCFEFWMANLSDIEQAAQRYHDISGRNGYAAAGHDFWLTREGHGAGFWDGDLPEHLGQRLTESCEFEGPAQPYIGDDKRVYLLSGQRTLNERVGRFLTVNAGKSKPYCLMRLPEHMQAALASGVEGQNRDCWDLYLTDRFPAGGLWFNYSDWLAGRIVASPANVAHMLDHDGDLPPGFGE